MELYSDTYYIQRIRAGHIESFACLADRYSQTVFALIVRVVQNREDAEELTQDVFLKVFRKLDSFKGDCAFSTWLYRIAYNTALSAVRKKKLEWLTIDDSTLNNFADTAVDNGLDFETTEARIVLLEKALDQLSPGERALILLFYKEEKSIEEIALISSLTQTNVKTKLFRIRKKLYGLFKQMED